MIMKAHKYRYNPRIYLDLFIFYTIVEQEFLQWYYDERMVF